jgi:electron transfer flavoprotein alpha subunit
MRLRPCRACRLNGRTLVSQTQSQETRPFSVLVLGDPPVSPIAGGVAKTTSLSPGTLAAITAASTLASGTPVHLLLTGPNSEAAAKTERIAGVSKVIFANNPKVDHGVAESVADVALSLHKKNSYTHIVASSSGHGRNVSPQVAAALDVAPVSDVIKIVDVKEKVFERPMYAGNAIATVKTSDSPVVMTVRATSFAKAEALSSSSPSPTVEAAADAESSSSNIPKWVSEQVSSTGARPELGAATKVVSGGRALKSADNFKLLYSLADALGTGSAVGASRAAVDAGYAPNDLQVGQTGKVVAPSLYMAVGVSGAIQHLAGMKDSKVIVAINKDVEAPIFQVADYGLVADLFAAVPELTTKLEQAKK